MMMSVFDVRLLAWQLGSGQKNEEKNFFFLLFQIFMFFGVNWRTTMDDTGHYQSDRLAGRSSRIKIRHTHTHRRSICFDDFLLMAQRKETKKRKKETGARHRLEIDRTWKINNLKSKKIRSWPQHKQKAVVEKAQWSLKIL